jgi:DNA-binding ferritin-like protein
MYPLSGVLEPAGDATAPPCSTLSTLSPRSSSELAPVARGAIADQMVVRELARRLAEVGERARTRMDRLGDLDLASQDVLIDVVRALEQQLWMIRVQLDADE